RFSSMTASPSSAPRWTVGQSAVALDAGGTGAAALRVRRGTRTVTVPPSAIESVFASGVELAARASIVWLPGSTGVPTPHAPRRIATLTLGELRARFGDVSCREQPSAFFEERLRDGRLGVRRLRFRRARDEQRAADGGGEEETRAHRMAESPREWPGRALFH